MPYNFVADGIHTKKLCSRLTSSEVQFYTESGRSAFLSPPPRTDRQTDRKALEIPCVALHAIVL